MNTLVILSPGEGLAVLHRIESFELVTITAILTSRPTEALKHLALKRSIALVSSVEDQLVKKLDLVIDARKTLDKEKDFTALFQGIPYIPSQVVNWVIHLMMEKETLIAHLQQQADLRSLILNLTHDGMIAIDANETITIMNPSAEKIMGLTAENAIGSHVKDLVASTQLPRILRTQKPEINQEQELHNGKKIITTRLPITDVKGNLLGAFAVFKDITDIKKLAEEVTNLESIQEMLNAIIQSSDEAISVVDEEGKGLLINPAYTRLTGLSEADVIGKPATTDISEGESMHMKVLKTRKAVRGVRMRVGQAKREVLVNVAPIIVNGNLKGSVGVLHDVSEISALTDQLNRARQIIRTLEAKYSFEDIVATSEEMKAVIEQAQLAANIPITVLLRGESGTGKELFAHAIHNASSRRYNKFVRVNCAAISESLLESELFGYEEGAFSGAKKGGKRGYFEEANGGSLFLDEIGELSTSIQAKLLRVLQEKEIVRVGGTTAIPIDVRVIAATNVDLEQRILEHEFRMDLYYRLNRMPIYIPALRERKEDIPELCVHLINKINQDFGRHVEGIDPTAISILNRYDWPGNVRELENVLGRAIIHMSVSESLIQPSHLREMSLNNERDKVNPNVIIHPSMSLNAQLEALEKSIIHESLEAHESNRTQTARALGISVRNLYYKMQKYGLD
ncbi:sigma-54-dependent Fis family transcriptional regulator [Pullulanibacillus sp. KACC 23026]|uniref:sigma-54 interaction domain-containing protein n=1 Tax=Pullulanibacillus sp. KACC 23026 TaxID=3028315 RepID=UPI0023B0CEFB|nr:sigma-54-dependent Fis family transcriptional regulator [Pullulanibacillus sp. KACC 23026]WEG14331.1 sigma-54-dependent Fis family transcriptional regulator [Pullulanibacillus sp. KACC 23026]